jgi:hypothetical protein
MLTAVVAESSSVALAQKFEPDCALPLQNNLCAGSGGSKPIRITFATLQALQRVADGRKANGSPWKSRLGVPGNSN